jgi:hypothetical protein
MVEVLKPKVECVEVVWNTDSVFYDSRGEAVEKGQKAVMDKKILPKYTRGVHYLAVERHPAAEYDGVSSVCVVQAKRGRGRPRKVSIKATEASSEAS